ncbi:MAG: hypothetical protein COS34_02000 [Lysobacterales bacterium CG02_land_8_20_14_3_00_62_12]|nr:MAG: hypothetical protein COS34_02000 [Xanthomonadales bacterium CG02_land_8_20_14_3_00_62_12]PJA43214.1 MAG: hypothetical protein CO182_00420 [Xanthomonadales bacterium CG_4_9_14_3_um_filter_62_6]
MKHYAATSFWRCFEALPPNVQTLARKNFVLLRQDLAHPSLQFKSVNHGRFRSVRIGIHYRALGIPVAEGVNWFWIGSHADYDRWMA